MKPDLHFGKKGEVSFCQKMGGEGEAGLEGAAI